jgi:spoIIIJ-associated protein
MTGEKSGEFRGKTVEAAIAAGLAALRLAREDAEIEIIRPGSRGVLGIGAEDAVVRVAEVVAAAVPPPAPRPVSRAEAPAVPAPASTPAAAPRPEPKATPAPRQEPKAAPVVQPAATAAEDGSHEERTLAAAEKGRELLAGMLEHMNVRARVEIVPQSDAEVDEADEDDRALVLNIVGDDLGVLIGRQNETLSAIEFVTRLMVNQQVRSRTSFVVDVNGYRAKRAESLRKLALRMAEQASESGRTVALEPMPPAERRIIHLALREHASVSTQSIGEGDRRKVTIVPKRD